MPLVIDASVLVKLVVEEPGTAAALALLDRDDERIAPDWALCEVGNALWNKVKFSRLLEVHAEDSLAAVPAFIDRFVAARELLGEAFRLSFRIRHP
ncbi:MAG: type II toxin-antitoxin system VapC family toxin, partial [Cypionkella sp.]